MIFELYRRRPTAAGVRIRRELQPPPPVSNGALERLEGGLEAILALGPIEFSENARKIARGALEGWD